MKLHTLNDRIHQTDWRQHCCLRASKTLISLVNGKAIQFQFIRYHVRLAASVLTDFLPILNARVYAVGIRSHLIKIQLSNVLVNDEGVGK